MIITREMVSWFNKRTLRHIGLVRKYCIKIYNTDKEKYHELLKRVHTHDRSKFKEPERTPYILITWQYKAIKDKFKFDIPNKLKEKMTWATVYHVKNNKHHPEYWSKEKIDIINKKDRDRSPDKTINATTMPDIDISEMVADWCAMSKEKGTSPVEWADKNINIRWKFTKEQISLIYELLEKIW